MTLKYSKRERTSKINESEGVCQSNLGTVWLTHFLNICDICVCDSGQVRTTLYNQRGIGRRGTTLMATTLLSARTKPGRQSTTFAIFATVSQQFRNDFANLHNAFLHLRICPVLPGFSFFFRSPSLQLNAKMRAEGICSAWRWFDCAANFVNFTNFQYLDRSGHRCSTVPSKLLKPLPTALSPLHPGK